MKIASFLFIAAFIISCSPSSNKETTEIVVDTIQVAADSPSVVIDSLSEEDSYSDQTKLETYLVDLQVSEIELQEISESVALLIYPTDERIEEMKKEYGEDDFYTVADDAMFYHGSAIGMFDSLGVKSIAADKQYVRFKGQEKTWTLDIRKKGAPDWSIIFFNKSKAPEIIFAIDLVGDSGFEEIKTYFGL